MGKLCFVGVGPGNKKYLTQEALDAIQSSSCFIAFSRVAQDFYDHPHLVEVSSLEELVSSIAAFDDSQDILVGVSGSVNFHSSADYLMKKFPKKEFEFIQGISSLDYLSAKIPIKTNDFVRLSAHGKTLETSQVIDALKHHEYLGLLLDKEHTASSIAQLLCLQGFEDIELYIGENLSYDDEKISHIRAKDAAHMSFHPLSNMILRSPFSKDQREATRSYHFG
ncbi:MAG: precorrin-6y C5,15-methyltransferase (decarboxylating) subunit CbiE, partial [Coriobacteriia bacterium]|nr:precorrin-6y C5,15-methyltransferase (decarboxylating) subunit CbiE [Coriobacteriia bacterium]